VLHNNKKFTNVVLYSVDFAHCVGWIQKKNYKSVVIVIQEVKAYTQAQTAHGTSALLQTFPAADVLTLILR
jgi:hypothetical protein